MSDKPITARPSGPERLGAEERATRIVHKYATPPGGIPLDEFKRHLHDSKRNPDRCTKAVWQGYRELINDIAKHIRKAEAVVRKEMGEELLALENAAAGEREALDCGHPRACWLPVADHCAACDAQAQAVKQARREALEETKDDTTQTT